MLIHWLTFVPALVLLLTPIGLFHGSRVQYRPIPSGFDGYWSRTIALGLHTIDLLRAVLGAWLLASALRPSLELAEAGYFALVPAQGAVLATQTAVLLVAILLQTFVCKEPDGALAPFAFGAGVVLGFLPALPGFFAVLVATVAALGLRSVGSFFPLLSLTVMAATTLILGSRNVYVATPLALTVFAPWLFTLLFPRHFVIAYAPKIVVELPPHR